jgi:hypothetical protein
MSDDTRGGLDARIDRVLRQQTAPRSDPAFRARVLARLDEPASAWAPWAPRLATAVAVVSVCVVLAFFVRVAPEPRVTPATQPTATATLPAPARGATAQSPQVASMATTEFGDAADRRAVGSPLGASEGGASASVAGARARRRLTRAADTRTARILLPPADSTVSPSLPPVDVGAVAVERIELRPLSTTERFGALGEPEALSVEPITVAPIGGR